MSDLFYARIDELGAADFRALNKSKPADKVNMFCPEDYSVSIDSLMLLNDVAATIKYIKLESEATLYFCLGQDSMQKNVNIVPLSGITVPGELLKAASTKKTSTEKRTRTRRAAEEKPVKADDKPVEQKPAMNEPEPVDENIHADEPEESILAADKWISANARETFAKQCGIPDSVPNKDAIIDDISDIIYKCKNLNDAVEKVSAKYAASVSDPVKANINEISIYITGTAFKGRYED